jgi:hypothetical protein
LFLAAQRLGQIGIVSLKIFGGLGGFVVILAKILN